MAPEQKEHRVADHRADIYSLGVVLYELLTGELPAEKLQPPSSRLRGMQIDVRLDDIVLRALETKPELRYQTAGEFRTQVESIATTAGTSAASSDPVEHNLVHLEGVTKFRSLTALRFSYLASLGCLGFLGFVPGGERLLGLFGLFGFIGIAYLIEAVSRSRSRTRVWFLMQSPAIKEIQSHLTASEKRESIMRDLMFTVWNLTTFFLPVAIAFFLLPNYVGWILAPLVLLVGLTGFPVWRKMHLDFLCATEWAKQRGMTRNRLRENALARPAPALRHLIGGIALVVSLLLFCGVVGTRGWPRPVPPLRINDPVPVATPVPKPVTAPPVFSPQAERHVTARDGGEASPLDEERDPNPVAASVSFGPVIERTMRLLDPAISKMQDVTELDFVTGRDASLPEEDSNAKNGSAATSTSDAERPGPMLAQAELLRGKGLMPSVTFSGTDIAFRKIPNGQWDAANPAQLSEEAQRWAWNDLFNPPFQIPDPKAWAKDEATLPADFAFYNREGGCGLLQLLSFSSKNRTAHIRYKLVKATPEGGASLEQAAALQTKAEQLLKGGGPENDPQILKLRARITSAEQIADLQAHLSHLRQIGVAASHPKALELRTRIAAIVKAGENVETNTGSPPGTSTSPSALSFGPVVTRVIIEDDADPSGMLLFNLQTGAGFLPESPISRVLGRIPFAEMTAQLRKQSNATKTDMLIRLSNQDFDWMTLDMAETFAGGPDEWQKITPERLIKLIAKWDAEAEFRTGKPTGESLAGYQTGPALCTAFRTRDNVIGVFQMRGYPDQAHPGIMIRYKLVQGTPAN